MQGFDISLYVLSSMISLVNIAERFHILLKPDSRRIICPTARQEDESFFEGM